MVFKFPWNSHLDWKIRDSFGNVILETLFIFFKNMCEWKVCKNICNTI